MYYGKWAMSMLQESNGGTIQYYKQRVWHRPTKGERCLLLRRLVNGLKQARGLGSNVSLCLVWDALSSSEISRRRSHASGGVGTLPGLPGRATHTRRVGFAVEMMQVQEKAMSLVYVYLSWDWRMSVRRLNSKEEIFWKAFRGEQLSSE